MSISSFGSYFLGAFAVLAVGFLILSVVRGGDSPMRGSEAVSSPSEIAPDFSLKNINGVGEVSLSTYRGEKPVVLAFWASWCPNCQRNMPTLGRLYNTYKDEVEVIGVNLRESPTIAQAFISRNELAFPNVVDTGPVARAYGIRFTNTHVLIDKEGRVVKTIPGDVHVRDIQALIQ